MRDTLDQAESLDLARTYLAAQITERIELTEQAIASTDAALTPEQAQGDG